VLLLPEPYEGIEALLVTLSSSDIDGPKATLGLSVRDRLHLCTRHDSRQNSDLDILVVSRHDGTPSFRDRLTLSSMLVPSMVCEPLERISTRGDLAVRDLVGSNTVWCGGIRCWDAAKNAAVE